MGFDYFVFYTEASAVCILILTMILVHDRLYSSQQEKQIWFDRAIIAYILYFISDISWAAMLSNQLPRTRVLVGLINFMNYALISLSAYQWFMFMAAAEKMPFRRDRRKRNLCLLPMLISILIMLIAYAAAPYFWINENNELNDLYYPMMIAAPGFYYLTAFVHSVINARKVESREDKKLYWLIGIFPLGVCAFGLIQVASLNAPTFCFGCTIMLVWFYLQHLQMMISVDVLTRLNNRGQIDRFMEQVQYKENVRVFIMMIDIDRFKQINDTYGHMEGDRALIFVSEALKQACEHCKASVFLGRYGGDEFTIIIQNPEEVQSGSDEYPDRFADAVRSVLSKKQEESRLPYDLQISIGCAELKDRNDTMKNCMARADKELYKVKRAKGTIR